MVASIEKCIWNTWLCAQKLCVNVPHLRLQNSSVEKRNCKRVNMKNLPVWRLKSRSWLCSSPCWALYLDSQQLHCIVYPAGTFYFMPACPDSSFIYRCVMVMRQVNKSSSGWNCAVQEVFFSLADRIPTSRKLDQPPWMAGMRKYMLHNKPYLTLPIGYASFFVKKRCTTAYVNVIKEKNPKASLNIQTKFYLLFK